MTVYVVNIKVKPESVVPFIEATRINHRSTRKEPGNFRFDLIQNQQKPDEFVLYEVYRDDEAVAEHKKTPHYAAWREAVAPFMAADRTGTCYRGVFPEDQNQW
jgi:autoinducer 2-degrading protein